MTSGDKVFLRSILAGFFLLIVGIGIPAAAAGEEQLKPASFDIKQLMQNLGQVKVAKGTFVERKYMSILSAPLEFSGTLTYMAPGHLEKHTLLPKPESMVLDQDKLTLENKAKKQRRTVVLREYPVIWAFVESIRSTLAGDLQTLNKFYRVTLDGNLNQWRLLLVPIEPDMKSVIDEIHITGSKNWVRTIEIIESGGDSSVMTVTEDAL